MDRSQDEEKYLTSNPFKRKLVNQFLKDIYFSVNQLRPKTILDIGCGEGFVDMYLLKNNPRFQIKAIEVSKEKIKKARKRAPGLSVQQGDAYDLPFGENSFDLTICLEVLEHLDKPEKVITEARRVSKKDCLFSVPNEPMFSLLTFISGKYISRLGRHPDHFSFYTKKTFKELIQKYFAKPVIMKPSSAWIIVIGEK